MQKYILVIVIVVLTSCTPQKQQDFEYDETVIIQLTSPEVVNSSQEYEGWITLRFTGIGHVRDDVLTDSFAKFNLNNEVYPWDQEPKVYGLIIDGKHMDLDFMNHTVMTTGANRVSFEHEYILMYQVGESPRTLSFTSADTTYEDNSGELIVEISRDMHPIFRGR